MLSLLLHFIKNVLITNITTTTHKCSAHVEEENKDKSIREKLVRTVGSSVNSCKVLARVRLCGPSLS